MKLEALKHLSTEQERALRQAMHVLTAVVAVAMLADLQIMHKHGQMVRRIEDARTAVVSSTIPATDCFPFENYGADLTFPANVVVELIPSLDPQNYAWEAYLDKVLQDSEQWILYTNEAGEPVYEAYIVPDVDGNGYVCLEKIGDRFSGPQYYPYEVE